MKLFGLIALRMTPAALTAPCLLAVSTLMAVGCAEKAVEQAPVNVEKERQDHIKMMQLESGKTVAPEQKDGA